MLLQRLTANQDLACKIDYERQSGLPEIFLFS